MGFRWGRSVTPITIRSRDSTPLWPAGHLPQVGRSAAALTRHSFDVWDWRKPLRHPISLLVGEMPSFGKEGRTEGAP
ncbi:MAG: hypothetical protein E5Y16_16025 [Mesorhizobium sp.]|nr:MAG: hypothetical protein EOS08_18810 [Mesorhizobium sp.]TJV37178.1 MAG: hypothetical protein E5Y16_16025 [Mesorhizobium sp.]